MILVKNPQHAKDMLYQVGEIALKRKALLLAELDKVTADSVIEDYTSGEVKNWDAIADKVLELAQIEDEFKTKQGLEDFIIVMDAFTSKNITKEVGKEFTQEAPIADTGFKTGRQINGTPVIVDSTLPKYTVYIIHKEALAFKSQPIEKSINIDLGLTSYTGVFFYDVKKLIDSKRVAKLTAKTATSSK